MSKQSKADRQAATKKRQTEAAQVMALSAHVNANAILAIHAKTDMGDGIQGLDFVTMLDSLAKSAGKVVNGDIAEVEAMLMNQAHTLENLFLILVRRASNAEYMKHLDIYAHLALKTQNQCRATLATLAELKNPRRATFIKQQNNAVNQQVNNGAGADPEKPEILESSASELLEHQHGERLDIGAAATASGTDKGLEAVGAFERAEDRRG